jgi:hypothetical protein
MIRSHAYLLGIVLCITVFFYVVSIMGHMNMRKEGEGFENIPMPHEMFKKLRSLLDKYDRPEIWNHAVQMTNKSPTELARIHLDSNAQ